MSARCALVRVRVVGVEVDGSQPEGVRELFGHEVTDELDPRQVVRCTQLDRATEHHDGDAAGTAARTVARERHVVDTVRYRGSVVYDDVDLVEVSTPARLEAVDGAYHEVAELVGPRRGERRRGGRQRAADASPVSVA